MLPCFADPAALAWPEGGSLTQLEALPRGVIGMKADGAVSACNRAEWALSGLTSARVIDRNFFESVAPCTSRVAQRFQRKAKLDAVTNDAFTLRMAPVRLQPPRGVTAARMYLLVERRDA